MHARLLLTLVFGIASLPVAASSYCQTPAPRPVLVELFTSEGCSSCPPADDLLRKLNGRQTGSGQLIVALSEHVTYWNRLGWTDPFSSDIFTARQNTYGDRFHLDSVYTPQVVVNGNREVLGSSGEAVLNAIRQQNPSAPEMLSILSIQPTANYLNVTISVSGPVTPNTQIFAVLADDLDTSHVQRGENADRTLAHVSVVRSLIPVIELKAAGVTTLTVPFTANPQTPQHLVLFAQRAGQGDILSVATKPIPSQASSITALAHQNSLTTRLR